MFGDEGEVDHQDQKRTSEDSSIANIIAKR